MTIESFETKFTELKKEFNRLTTRPSMIEKAIETLGKEIQYYKESKKVLNKRSDDWDIHQGQEKHY